ncbi:hypothetical protein L195_g000110 [Trifolium pratense]|uniref:Uncharacterized protein n=1 Tax=Trifolium pratense TaxID=57577 RepID=A0A2K3NKY1_TRIPR|nr:hypothetical protein L195_g000110 [Trifolium pratense]
MSTKAKRVEMPKRDWFGQARMIERMIVLGNGLVYENGLRNPTLIVLKSDLTCNFSNLDRSSDLSHNLTTILLKSDLICNMSRPGIAKSSDLTI